MKKSYTVVLTALIVVFLSGCTAEKELEGVVTSGQEFIGKSEDTGQAKPVARVNFSKRGTILNWDSRTESYVEEWTFLYDEPGVLALNVKLVFDENSVCNIGKGDVKCDPSKLANGTTTSVEGFEDGGKLLVIKLSYP